MSRMIGGSVPVLNGDGTSGSIAVASGAVVYTKAFDLGMGLFFGLWAKAYSGTGTPEIKIEIQESYVEPIIEGSADGDWVTPDGFVNIFDSIADQVAHIKTVTPVPMKYGRYKLTGINANPADAVITLKNFIQEQS